MMKGQEIKQPSHIAIIMDGNGRWAKARGLPRTEGHRVGAERVRDIVYACLEMGVKNLTIYAFSKENWKRPRREVSGIMGLARFFFKRFFDELKKEGVFFVHLGDTEGLSPGILKIIRNMEENNAAERKLYLSIAFNYSGRSEITQAVREIASLVERGDIEVGDITQELVSEHLYSADLPDPDLLIRTGGEHRVSNFLLWQIAYSELWVTDTLWPDFSKQTLLEAIDEYHRRERRFGGL
ncbi:MAG: di-trans,poly-cis-decaprenylcistransferase [Spirochaetes bacterium]|nr:di-trans,poly-cis-decaprenylcistransferase [Spirochaetota bacterium]